MAVRLSSDTCYHTQNEKSIAMSSKHKNKTISFRITKAEHQQIEARILASEMMKIDYVIRSCIYNRICVVGKKEIIYPLVQTVNALYLQLLLYLIQFHLLMKSMISFASFIRMHLLFYYASGSNHRSKPRIYHMLYSL